MYEELKKAFELVLKKQKPPTAGIDKISAAVYADRPKQYKKAGSIMKVEGMKLLKSMENELTNKTYKLRPYDEILVLKGANKSPRRISKPTIRDKIFLKLLNQRLLEVDEYKRLMKKPYTVVKDIKSFMKTGKNLNFLKLDIAKFYDNIDITRLLSKLRLDGHIHDETIDWLEQALVNPTVPNNYKKEDRNNYIPEKGVPQGLSISNLLAEIYLMDFEETIEREIHDLTAKTPELNLACFRYVDDILILSNNAYMLDGLKTFLSNGLEGLGLTLNDEKEHTHHFKKDGFGYLGYRFDFDKITVLEKNKKKMLDRMVRIIKEADRKLSDLHENYKDSEKKLEEYKQGVYFLLLWRLNIIISGAFIDKFLFGWMAYFRQIDSVKQLQEIDFVLKRKLLKTYLKGDYYKEFDNIITKGDGKYFTKLGIRTSCNSIPNLYTLKSLVKVFDEIRHRKNPNNYKHIMNPTKIDEACQRSLLKNISSLSVKRVKAMKNYEVKYHFNREIFTEIKKLLDTIGLSGYSG